MERFLVVSGVLFWASLFLSLSRRWVKWSEWLTESPPDIPDFVRCTCVSVTTIDNPVAVRQVSPQCPIHKHEWSNA